ncbi:Chloroperoxidase [Mycena floridula]|nr:Chloroperoxidase [Mycena floridula]
MPKDSPGHLFDSLTNHGFLPRDGRGLTLGTVIQAATDGFNFQHDVLIFVAKLSLMTSGDLDTFTLDDLKLHNTIEHDASISRSDFAFGDNLHFNETIFQAQANSNPGVDYYNVTSAGQVSQATNPQLINTSKEFTARSGVRYRISYLDSESALYLSVMGNPMTGVAPKTFVNIFFREEHIPIEEGWTHPNVLITGDTLNRLTVPIMQASD